MKTMIKSDNFIGSAFVDLAPFSGELDGTFISLCSTVGKKYLIKATMTGQ